MRRLCLCLLAAALSASGDEFAIKPEARILAECLIVTLPQKAALPLLPELNDDQKIEGAYAQLLQMVGRGEATLVADLILNGTGALRAESMEEMKYAAEYLSPSLPDGSLGQGPEAWKNWPLVGATPTAFATRNVGASVELEPEISVDAKWIIAKVNVQHSRFVKNLRFDIGVRPDGEHLWIEQPSFSTVHNTATIELASGKRMLLGVHKVPSEENTMELFILRLTARAANTIP